MLKIIWRTPLICWWQFDFAITCIFHRPQPEYTRGTSLQWVKVCGYKSSLVWKRLQWTVANKKNHNNKCDHTNMHWVSICQISNHIQLLWLFSHDGKVRILNFNSRCAFWIKIQNTQKRPCVCQITSQNVIWNAHLKSRYRGVFQLRFSQITQRNLCMNDLTSESCFGGRS